MFLRVITFLVLIIPFCTALAQAMTVSVRCESQNLITKQNAEISVLTGLSQIEKNAKLLEAVEGDNFEHENLEKVILLLKQGAHVNAKDDSGSAALHKAALMGKSKVVKLLLAHAKIDSNARDTSGGNWTALHWALCEGHVEIAKLLLAFQSPNGIKFNVDAKDSDGYTDLQISVTCNRTEIVRLLLYFMLHETNNHEILLHLCSNIKKCKDVNK